MVLNDRPFGNALAVSFFRRCARLSLCAYDFHCSIQKRRGKLGRNVSSNESHVLYCIRFDSCLKGFKRLDWCFFYGFRVFWCMKNHLLSKIDYFFLNEWSSFKLCERKCMYLKFAWCKIIGTDCTVQSIRMKPTELIFYPLMYRVKQSILLASKRFFWLFRAIIGRLINLLSSFIKSFLPISEKKA